MSDHLLRVQWRMEDLMSDFNLDLHEQLQVASALLSKVIADVNGVTREHRARELEDKPLMPKKRHWLSGASGPYE